MFNLNEEIGKRISRLRKSNGMTQEDLAEKLNCSIKHIIHVERVVASLSLDLLIEASDLLDCTLDYLVKGEEATPISKVPAYVIKVLSSREARMQNEKELLLSYLAMYRKLREETLDELIKDAE